MADGRVRLIFVLTGIEKLVSVSFTGRGPSPTSVLLQNANLQVNAEFQPEQVGPAVEAVQAAYFRIGYRHAQVNPVRKAAPGGLALEFRVDEGRRRASRRCGSRATWRSTATSSPLPSGSSRATC